MYFTLDDAAYWYEIHGEGIPIVMLHGFTGRTWTWNRVREGIGSTFRVITIDLPGHGNTKMEQPRTMEDCCRDLDALFEYLELKEFHLLGYSMGGRTALTYALNHPKKVKSLILESASPGLESKDERIARINKDENLAKNILEKGLESFVHRWENIPLFHSQKQLPKEIQMEVRKERLSQSAEGLAISLRTMGSGQQPSNWHRLQEWKKPVLLLCGEYDEKFIRINNKMQLLFPNGTLNVCENAGHAIHVEKPEIFGKLISGFIFQQEQK